LRTPLSILRGYIENVARLAEMPARIFSNSRSHGTHSKRLDLLAEDLLTLAQLEFTKSGFALGKVDLSRFFGKIIRDGKKKLATNISYDRRCCARVALDLADRARLQEALYNLLDNAVKYSCEHGEITLQARQRDQQVVLSVGGPTASALAKKICRAFSNGSIAWIKHALPKTSGGPVWLAIVKHIAQLHGVTSSRDELGKGTTIRMVLPMSHKT